MRQIGTKSWLHHHTRERWSLLLVIHADNEKQRYNTSLVLWHLLTVAPQQCDASRPICSTCLTNHRECSYSTQPLESRRTATKRKLNLIAEQFEELQTSHSTLQQLFAALQSRDDADAAAIYKRIRYGDDLESILRHVCDGDLLVQMHTTPETRFRHQFPGRIEMPTSVCTSENDYLKSLMYEATFAPPNDASPQSEHHKLSRVPDERFNPQYLKPYSAAILVDERLDMMMPSKWTTVCDDDELMRTLFRLYFQYEYQWFPCFQKDYFLDDLLSGSPSCCSSLLVNSILAQACVRTHSNRIRD